MSDLSPVKAAIDGLADGLVDLAVVLKKKESLLQEGVDLVASLLADQDFKDQVAKVMAVGLSGLLSAVKSMPSDIPSDLALAMAEVPVVEKVIAAFKA